jgi:hypothetical protein
MGQTLSQTFPLWIQPWISGIYAFHYPDRCLDAAACGGNIPSILTSYIDEVALFVTAESVSGDSFLKECQFFTNHTQ